ncbi:MAG: hypothetical protein QGI45_10925 [Myxococcota bacterium]|jgi:hypothetical protein|nr:hypothetical protein [Myxococcota bacterium]
MMKALKYLAFLSLFLYGAVGLAGDDVKYKKRTVIDFSEALIEGELTKPEGSYIVNRKVSRFSSLIKLRENFVPELLSTPDHL